MKAYKATRNMKCIDFTYEIGKTYTFNGTIEMCEKGFHFCKKPQDILNYYGYSKDFVLLEIEVLGKVITEDNKFVTDKFKVIRIVDKSEYTNLLGITLDSNDNLIKQVDPYGNTWIYEYDKNSNKIKEVYPNGDTWIWEYDKNGNLIKRVNLDGKTWSRTIQQCNDHPLPFKDGKKVNSFHSCLTNRSSYDTVVF